MISLTDTQVPRPALQAERMQLFATEPPDYSDEYLAAVAKAFQMTPSFEDRGTRLVCEDLEAVLEVFVASSSLRWWRAALDTQPPSIARSLPKDDEAVRAADDFLRVHGLTHADGKVHDITRAVMRSGTEDKVESGEIEVNVNYRFQLNGFPVFGPGAKARVTMREGAEVWECYWFWRHVTPAEERTLITERRAMELLFATGMFDELGADAKAEFSEIALGYYALPPRETQGVLLPVYAIRGNVSTRYLPEYKFRKFVPAIEYDGDEAKRRRFGTTAVRKIF